MIRTKHGAWPGTETKFPPAMPGGINVLRSMYIQVA